MEELIEEYAPDYMDFVAEVFENMGEFLVGGILVAFLFWTIGFVIKWIFDIMSSWAETRTGGSDGE